MPTSRGAAGKRKRVAESPEPAPPRRTRTADRSGADESSWGRMRAHSSASSIEIIEISPPSTRSATRQVAKRSGGQLPPRNGTPTATRQVAKRSGGQLPPRNDPPTTAPRPRQLARRTGGAPRNVIITPSPEPSPQPSPQPTRSPSPLPIRQTKPKPKSKTKPKPRMQLVVEVPPPPSARMRIPSSTSFSQSHGYVPLGIDLPAPPSLPTARKRRKSSSNSQLSVSPKLESHDMDKDSEEDDDNVPIGAAGPGPRTRANRRGLQPVPQLESTVFHEYMTRSERDSLQVENIDDSWSPGSVAEESHVPEREVTVINGEEAYIIAGSDSDDGPGMTYECPIHKCMQVVHSDIDLADHIRSHADLYDPTPKVPRNRSPSRKRMALQNRADEAEKAELREEVANVKAQLKDSIARGETSLQSVSQLEARLVAMEKAAEELQKRETTLTAQLLECNRENKVLQSMVDAIGEAEAELPRFSASGSIEGESAQSQENEIKMLQHKVKKLASKLKRAQMETDFVREQYQTASNSAVTEVERANKLEKEVQQLTDKLTLGLRQRNMLQVSEAKQARAAAKAAEDRLELLLEQSRRTDDALRRKAAGYDRLIRERADDERALHEERCRADQLSKRNTQLSEQVARLRGRALGAFDPPEDSDDDVEPDTVPISSAQAPSAPAPALAPPQVMAVIPAFAPDNHSARSSPALAANATLAECGIEMYRCKWLQDDDTQCPELFHTQHELEAHGLGHIEKFGITSRDITEMV